MGSVFGAPLAVEALAAFFIESTFLGIWIFGYKRISEGWHLATIWLAAFGSALSAYFILAANSWMQHPVGYRVVNGRAEMTSFWKLLTNPTVFFAFPHTVIGAYANAGVHHPRHLGLVPDPATATPRCSRRLAKAMVVVGVIATCGNHDHRALQRAADDPAAAHEDGCG